MQLDPSATTAAPLLLLGAGTRPYRECLLQRMAAQYPIVLADQEAPAWTAPYLREHLLVDLADTESTAAAVKRFAAQVPVAGICTYMEHHVELAAQLAAQLDLPGSSPAAVASCRDKAETRRRFTEEEVPSALSRVVADEDDAVEGAREIGYPVVVKPRGMAGSAGVLRADTDAEVRSAYRRATQETVLGLDAYAVPGVLVEKYLAGPEISAETVVLAGGEVRIVAITRKRLGEEPRFLETGHSVDARDPLLTDAAVTQAVTRAVRALGLEQGVLHVELRITERGPALIEVNARPGGDLIPLLVLRATGIDLPRAAAALATGTAPDLTPTRQQAAAVRFLYPAFSGELARLRAPVELLVEPWLDRLVWTRRPGERVEAPPNASIDDRLAHWVVTGADAAECDRRLVEVLVQVDARTDAPAYSTSCTR
ncbi:ATP-grasp domain-containing protein [Streptomyces flaveolus]|uniref:ATP-grasp domain-containing protein n=1 Tax=Streptomyces flaveolus TaxID=67297 RepID=UPI0036F70C0B